MRGTEITPLSETETLGRYDRVRATPVLSRLAVRGRGRGVVTVTSRLVVSDSQHHHAKTQAVSFISSIYSHSQFSLILV